MLGVRLVDEVGGGELEDEVEAEGRLREGRAVSGVEAPTFAIAVPDVDTLGFTVGAAEGRTFPAPPRPEET